MSDYDPSKPVCSISLGESDFYISPNNTSLHTFIGRAAMYDYVYLRPDDSPSTLVFKELQPEAFNNLRDIVTKFRLPQHINLPSPCQRDIQIFDSASVFFVEDELSKGIPNDWL